MACLCIGQNTMWHFRVTHVHSVIYIQLLKLCEQFNISLYLNNILALKILHYAIYRNSNKITPHYLQDCNFPFMIVHHDLRRVVDIILSYVA